MLWVGRKCLLTGFLRWVGIGLDLTLLLGIWVFLFPRNLHLLICGSGCLERLIESISDGRLTPFNWMGEFRLYKRSFLPIIYFLLQLGCLLKLSLVCLKKFSETFYGRMAWHPRRDIVLSGSGATFPNNWGDWGLKILEFKVFLLQPSGLSKHFGGMNLGRFL